MNKFDFIDIPDNCGHEQFMTLLTEARQQSPKAVVCLRQTSGTDFPPFMAIESPEYHEQCNLEGEFELVQVLPF